LYTFFKKNLMYVKSTSVPYRVPCSLGTSTFFSYFQKLYCRFFWFIYVLNYGMCKLHFFHGIVFFPHTLKMIMNVMVISLPMVECSTFQHFPLFSTFLILIFWTMFFSIISPSMFIFMCFFLFYYFQQTFYYDLYTHFSTNSIASKKHTISYNKWKQPTMDISSFFIL